MGSFLAASKGSYNGLILVFCVTTTIFLQILSNLANDYGDTVHGADNEERKGPSRTVQSGAISLTAMKRAVGVFIFLSLVSGLILLHIAFGRNWNSLLFFLGLGVLSIVATITYTVGDKPYGYVGLGDLSVLFFFGLVGVMGSSYLYLQSIQWNFALPAMSCGLFSVAVLNINNIRDIDSDQKAGKYSIPVRIGREKAILYHWALLFSGMATSVVFTMLNSQSYWQWLFLLVIPLLIKNGIGVTKNKEAKRTDPYLKQMAITTLLFVLLFGLGLLL